MAIWRGNLLFAFLLGLVALIDQTTANPPSKMIDDGKCTSIGVGKGAMIDLSTITTHNADCQECDIRITHVPAYDWNPGSKRPIFDLRGAYPRVVEKKEHNIHGDDYLLESVDTSIYPWQTMEPMMFIDQVPHTYAYTMGTFPLQNEKQLTMGESTCPTKFWSIPSNLPNGSANFNIRSLMEVAMERCDTARCAITLMGDLAVKYGFYGPETPPYAVDGEALTIGDPNEVWVFHVVPDDTHTSAVWVAQRVPDNHITVIANQFIITTIDLNDPENFLASENIFDVAERSGYWSRTSGEPFNFLTAYGKEQGVSGHGCTRRVWRVFTLASPSLPLLPFTDQYGTFGYGLDHSQPYPFSIQPEKLLSLQDIMGMCRDNYEGTPFDLSEGPDSGPFGDVIRSSGMSLIQDPINGMTKDELDIDTGRLYFTNRPVSLWRTSYSSIAQARSAFPNLIGGVTWLALYAPHHSSFTPVYSNVPSTPTSLNYVTQYHFNRTKNYWVHSVVGNYLSRWYKWTIGDIRQFQKSIEEEIFTHQTEIETNAVKVWNERNEGQESSKKGDKARTNEILTMLSEFQNSTANKIVSKWWSFFERMVSTYRDVYHVKNFNAENFQSAPEFINYPRWWMEMVGFWGPPGTPSSPDRQPVGVSPVTFNSLSSLEEYQKTYPEGTNTKYYLHATTDVSPSSISGGCVTTNYLLAFGCLVLGIFIGVLFSSNYQSCFRRKGYTELPADSQQDRI